MTDVPIACTLPVTEVPGRLALIDALTVEARVEPLPGGIRARFGREAETRVREFVALESRCCAFLRFDVRVEDDVTLDVTGPPDARPVIEALFSR
jgi:hypothetical protein